MLIGVLEGEDVLVVRYNLTGKVGIPEELFEQGTTTYYEDEDDEDY